MGFKLTNCGGLIKGFKGCRRSFFKTHTPPSPPLVGPLINQNNGRKENNGRKG
jgi:hypothetical protein